VIAANPASFRHSEIVELDPRPLAAAGASHIDLAERRLIRCY
jgi:hypothetical protein